MAHLTDAEFTAAEARGKAMLEAEPRATSAQYSRKTGQVTIELVNGCTCVFPTRLVQDLSDACPDDLAGVEVDGMGFNLHWPKLDADLYVPALVAGVFGTRDWMREGMLQAIPDIRAGDPDAVAQFREIRGKASDLVFPATNAFLTTRHSVNELSYSHSLDAIDIGILRAVDLEAHCNPVLKSFVKDLKSRLKTISDIDDVTAFDQIFEVYGEIIAYRFLDKRVPTRRLPEREGQKTPDFQCEPPNGKPFRVEVKTFNIVGGDARNRDMMDDGLNARIELEEQVRAGKADASAVTVIDPYRKAGETGTYDPRSFIRVIDTLREKSLQTFKEGQFADDPTFALAITDRLVLPGRKHDLAPYYYSDSKDGGIASGVLWHMAYGRPGTPIFRLPEFGGAKSLEGHLKNSGLFVDDTRPFPGPGLIVLDGEQGEHHAFGLANEAYSENDDWRVDDTYDVLCRLCDRWNNEVAIGSWDISADIRKKTRVNT